MKLEPFFVASQLVIAGTIMMSQGKDYGLLPEKKTQDLLQLLKPQPPSLLEERQNITEAGQYLNKMCIFRGIRPGFKSPSAHSVFN